MVVDSSRGCPSVEWTTPYSRRCIMTLESFITHWIGSDLPVRIKAYDGSDIGPRDARTTITIQSPDALVRILSAPGELGLARAYISGDLAIDGDVYDVLGLHQALPDVSMTASDVARLLRLVGVKNLRWIRPPDEEFRGHGRMHSRTRDAAAISYHYDVSNDFYRLVLGPSMTYSCAVFTHPAESLEQAQTNKYDLICRKLGLEPGMRLLDIGCGWGGMAIHAARHYGVSVKGVTLSQSQVDLARDRVAEEGLSGIVEIERRDYRDINDGPFDAISSIGMFEHVGAKRLDTYFSHVADLLEPGGLVLNHAIARDRPPGRGRVQRSPFIDRYVFPDGELHEVGGVVSALQAHGLEVRNLESLREHYALTLRAWVANLEQRWDEAVDDVGIARARIWRLYMAVCAVGFEENRIHVDQVLAARTPANGQTRVPLRPDWYQTTAPAALESARVGVASGS